MTIDQELQAALEVTPSAEFLARVRMRIANEPPPSRWGFWWWLPVACTAAAAVIVVAAVVWRPAHPMESAPLSSRSLGEITVPATKPNAQQVAQPFRPASVAGRPEGLRDARASAPINATEPEILIDRREASALRALLDGGPLEPEKTYAGPSLDRIEIAPLAILPLDPGGEGVRQ